MSNSQPPSAATPTAATPAAAVSAAADRLALFSNAPLMPGEDAAPFSDLRDRLCAALKPADVIDDIFVSDIAYWQREVMRWRSFKGQMLANLERALSGYLGERLRREHYVDTLKTKLAEAYLPLQSDLSRDQCIAMAQAIDPRHQAFHQDFEPRMREWFMANGRRFDLIEDQARAERATELVRQFRTEGPESLSKFLDMVGATVEEFTAVGLEVFYGDPGSMLDRVDQRLATAETRRDRALRELARHKLVWGEIMRQMLKGVEGEPEVKSLPPQAAPSIAASAEAA